MPPLAEKQAINPIIDFQEARPQEVWLNILSRLMPSELIRVSNVCKSWRNLSSDEKLPLSQMKAEYIAVTTILKNEPEDFSQVASFNSYRNLLFTYQLNPPLKVYDLKNGNCSESIKEFSNFGSFRALYCFENSFAAITSKGIRLFDYSFQLLHEEKFERQVGAGETIVSAAAYRNNWLAHTRIVRNAFTKSITLFNIEKFSKVTLQLEDFYCANLFFLPNYFVNMSRTRGHSNFHYHLFTFQNENWTKVNCIDSAIQDVSIFRDWDVINDECIYFHSISMKELRPFYNSHIVNLAKDYKIIFKNYAIAFSDNLVAFASLENTIEVHELFGQPIKAFKVKDSLTVLSLKILSHTLLVFNEQNFELWNFKEGQRLADITLSHSISRNSFMVLVPKNLKEDLYLLQVAKTGYAKYFGPPLSSEERKGEDSMEEFRISE